MAFRVEVTTAAKTQIQDVYHWYKRNVPSFADSWLNGLLESLNTLRQFPLEVGSATSVNMNSVNNIRIALTCKYYFQRTTLTVSSGFLI